LHKIRGSPTAVPYMSAWSRNRKESDDVPANHPDTVFVEMDAYKASISARESLKVTGRLLEADAGTGVLAAVAHRRMAWPLMVGRCRC